MSRLLVMFLSALAFVPSLSAIANAQVKISEAKALVVYAPRPAYPYEARGKHLSGRGVVVVTVDQRSGNVTSARMLQSTGRQILDDAALAAFGRWRFRPGTVSQVKIPINFTMRGVRYPR